MNYMPSGLCHNYTRLDRLATQIGDGILRNRDELPIQDCLKILELTTCRSPSDLKEAYYRQIRIWHPDQFHTDPLKHAEATERTKCINAANDRLADLVGNPNSGIPYSSPTSDQNKVKRTYPFGFPEKDITEIYLQSNRIISVGYNNASRTLFIKFRGNVVYGYFQVHHLVYSEFVHSKFPDKFAESHIYQQHESMRL